MDEFSKYVLGSKHLAKTVLTEDGHWLWNGPKSRGYGRAGFTAKNVHVMSFEHFHRPVKGDEMIRHRCGIRNCYAPEHLVAGTHGQNMEDAAAAGTLNLVRLTPSDVREIRARIRSRKETLTAIGDAYGVTASAISSIKEHKTWGWLDG